MASARRRRVTGPSLAPGDTVRIRDERWVVVRHTAGGSASILDVQGRDPSNRHARASFLLPFEVVDPLLSDRSPHLVRPRRWRRTARALIAEASPSYEALRAPLRARISLMPFQLEPVLAVTHAMASRILIADEVGLGKTIQAALIIAEVLERSRHGRVLVVTPAALREQWQSELRERFGIDAWIADSAAFARESVSWGFGNPWSGRPVTITSIDFVKRPEVMRPLEGLLWDAAIFDEAHGLAGHSDRAIAANALARRARTVVLLTATPHSGDERAFESLCRIGDLNNEFPLLTFRRSRRDVGLAIFRRTFTLRVRPSPAEREMHRGLAAYARKVRKVHGGGADPAHLAMVLLTRRACSSAWSLARSIERRLALLASHGGPEMSQMPLPLFDAAADEEPGAELSAPGLDDRNEERRCLHRLLNFARLAEPAESKLAALLRLLRRAREPAIVFTEYRDTLTRVASALAELAPVTLHGGLTLAERRENLRRFTTGAARLLLATDAASEGLNLHQRCRLVINLELPWTPLRLEQRVGRVERIGQLRRVHTVHLLAAGTAEETFVTRLRARRERATHAVEQLRRQRPESRRLHSTAEAEADRLAHLRLVAASAHERPLNDRPAVTVSRRGASRGRSVWAFHLVFTDAFGHPIWRTLVGVITAHPDRAPVLRSIERHAGWIGTWLNDCRSTAAASLEKSLRSHLHLASRREHALIGGLQNERARLSPSLLQAGLFDRRAERAFAAQNAVLEEALARCRTRIDEIAAAGQPACEPARLAFLVIGR